MRTYLDFEKAIAEVDGRIAQLPAPKSPETAPGAEAAKLEMRLERALRQAYRRLGPWQKLQVARHPERPCAAAYVEHLIDSWVPLAGDPLLPPDPALTAGLGRLRGWSVAVVAQVRDGDAARTIGAAGWRRAERVLRLAGRLHLPVVSLVDTRGDGPADGPRDHAMLAALDAAVAVRAPVIAAVIGEAGGFAARCLLAADRVLMLEHAVAYPEPPEAAAEVLWQDSGQERAAAEALKLTAEHQEAFGLVDQVLAEPLGGAHRDPAAAMDAVGTAVAAALADLIDMPMDALLRRRRERLRAPARRAGD